MHPDVVELRTFYYRTKLGRAAQRALQEALRKLWPDVAGLTVVGYGFAAPMLRPLVAEAGSLIGLMPAQQGVMPWPSGEPNRCALVEETRWPLEADSADRILIAHGLETCERPDALLDEIWRVLRSSGRAVFIVPNRSGLWARRDVTPFGFGRPYSFGQLEAQLRNHRFEPGAHAAALYSPPSHRRFLLQTAPLWERIGRRWDPRLVAGALLAEASKQVYARPDRRGKRVLVPGPLDVLEGLAGPKPEPAGNRRTDGKSGPPA